MNHLPGLCLDFDGVIHSYTSGWKATDIIPDPLVEGAIAALYEYVKHFKVHIFSARSADGGGIIAMAKYIGQHDFRFRRDDLKGVRAACTGHEPILEFLHFPVTKPPCLIYVDDRGFRFEGKWPSVEELKALSDTWNKKASS